MDCRRTLAALALGLAGAAGMAGAAPVPVLREMRWIDPALPRAEIVRLLTTQPAECLTLPPGPAARAQIAVGRAVFGSPLLLGGQAARAGVSCATCHQAGRGNPHFAFPGVSGPPGTADVTSSLFSSKRGDGIFNPRPIPDLAAGIAKVDRDPQALDLHRFIRGQVVEEFDGLEPPVGVVDGLAAYVRALGGTCGADVPRTAAGEAEAVSAAVSAAIDTLGGHNAPAAHLLIAAARSALGRIDERFAGVPGIGRRLAERDAELLRIQRVAAANPAAARQALRRWTTVFGRDIVALRAAEARSLYAAVVLDRAMPLAVVR